MPATPTVSIIVLAYTVEPYVARALQSATEQSLSDIQIVVVDDASTDNTRAVVEGFAERDKRVELLALPHNRGRHLARAAGVAQAKGAYTLFLDADDELDTQACEKLVARMQENPVDILHFGVEVIGEEGLPESERAAFEAFANANRGRLEGDAILAAIFDAAQGYTLDWRTWQRLFPTKFIQGAFEAMADTRLDRAEDAHEGFVIADRAATFDSFDDYRGYIYHYGLGITGATPISAETFDGFCEQFAACLGATRAYVGSKPSDVHAACLDGMQAKCLEILSNDWHTRLSPELQEEGLRSFSRAFGQTAAARELWRLIRDEAYAAWESGAATPGSTVARYVKLGRAFPGRTADENDAAYQDYRQLKAVARGHINNIAVRAREQAARTSDMRIFVVGHKAAAMPESSILQPIRVGTSGHPDHFLGWLSDAQGENIAEKNPRYCELTAQYWAWKNVDADSCDYVGFCHYRRHFNFSRQFAGENDWGEVMAPRLDEAAIERFGLRDADIRKAVEGWDLITTPIHDLRAFPGEFQTPWEHYADAAYLHIEDLETMAGIVKRMHPDYATEVDDYLGGTTSCFCNMYIMRTQLFAEYCAWLFPVLDACDAAIDYAHYSQEALRTVGHLAERLFNIYYLHLIRTRPELRIKQLQCVHFEDPAPAWHVPAIEVLPEGMTVVPVVFAADGGYVAQLATTMLSMLENSSRERFLDIVVLQRGISWPDQERMRAMVESYENTRLAFVNAVPYIAGRDLVTSNPHISIETYYRFLVPEVLPFYDKALYLDSDILILGDVGELFEEDLGGNLIGAVHDIDYCGNLNFNDGYRMNYTRDVLGMEDPYAYFQAGVLVFDLRALRQFLSVDDWLALATNDNYIYDDQDVLNAACEGFVHFVDPRWNVMHDCWGRVQNYFSFAPAGMYAEYLEARQNPLIVHYAGGEKPWTNPECDFGTEYWDYAWRTPFAQRLLDRVAIARAKEHVPAPVVAGPPEVDPDHVSMLGDHNPLRMLVDPLLPVGSARRETLKQVARRITGRA